MTCVRSCTVAAAVVALLAGSWEPALTQAPGLKIVVISGEDAVNIIQQKTAVAPIVEVRDRNDQPVAGALVTFAIENSKAATFAGGVQTLSVTTDVAGRAAVNGLTPLATGTYGIRVGATFEGQTATTTIGQTNVATAAAAQAIGAGVAAGAAVGAVAAGGGGLSGIAIGAIAAAAGGGALLAVKAAGGDSGSANPAISTSPTSTTSPTSPTAPAGPTTYSGSLAGQLIMTTNSSGSVCSSTTAINGTLTITLEPRTDGTATGTGRTTGTQTEIAFTASPLCQALPGSAPFNTGGPITGAPGNLGYSFVTSGTGPTPAGGSVTVTNTTSFSGALSGGVITGTMTHTQVSTGQGTPTGGPINGSGTTSFPVTLR